uniref:Uncharacterized protein n=1 Tax=Oryza meridionalis TaxID=40149 RepID=A0A0E0CAV4_9ORYZ
MGPTCQPHSFLLPSPLSLFFLILTPLFFPLPSLSFFFPSRGRAGGRQSRRARRAVRGVFEICLLAASASAQKSPVPAAALTTTPPVSSKKTPAPAVTPTTAPAAALTTPAIPGPAAVPTTPTPPTALPTKSTKAPVPVPKAKATPPLASSPSVEASVAPRAGAGQEEEALLTLQEEEESSKVLALAPVIAEFPISLGIPVAESLILTPLYDVVVHRLWVSLPQCTLSCRHWSSDNPPRSPAPPPRKKRERGEGRREE